jgi:hypothetical protein
MAVTYTITSTDVSNVSPSSKLREGVICDWTNQKIYVPATVGQVTAQWVIDNCRFLEMTAIGLSRARIVEGGGKTQIGVDFDTGSPIETPTIAILQDEWKLVTQKTTGTFIVKDVYMRLGALTSIPYDDVAGVFIQYLTAVSGAVATVTSGSGLDVAQDAKLSALFATLQGSGVFSAASLINAPTGGVSAIAIATEVWGYSGVIASNVITRMQAGLATSAALSPIAANITDLRKETGGIPGITATVLDAQTGTPGYMRTSDNQIRKIITQNPDGSVSIVLE